MTLTARILLTFGLLCPALLFGFEGPASGSAVTGPEIFSTDRPAVAPPARELPTPRLLVPDPAALAAARAAPTEAPVNVRRMPPPTRQGNVPLLETFTGQEQARPTPADPAIAAGRSEVVELSNSGIAIYDKYGERLFATTLEALFLQLDPPENIYQPRVVFDPTGQRWVITALANAGASSIPESPTYWLVAVSRQAAAMGKWWLWKLDASANGPEPTSHLANDQELGYDDERLCLAANMFTLAGDFRYAKLRFLDKHELYAGRLDSYDDIWGFKDHSGKMAFSVRPMRSPLGTQLPMHFASVRPDAGDAVMLWRFGDQASLIRFERLPALKVRPYSAPPLVSQPAVSGTEPGPLIEPGPCRVEGLQVERGDLHLVFHERLQWSGTSSSAFRYVRIRLVTDPVASPPVAPDMVASPRVMTDETIGSPQTSFFNPSVAADRNGNSYFAFNFADPNRYPGTGYAGWRAGGELTETIVLEEGRTGYGTGERHPFGRKTGITLDPTSDNVAWVGGAFSLRPAGWGTALAELSFDPLRFRATPLPPMARARVNSDTLFKFGQTVESWNAAAFRSGPNANLEYWDGNFTTFRVRSTHDLSVVLTEVCVSAGTRNPLDTMGVKLLGLPSGATGTLQWHQASRELDPGASNGPFEWQAGDVVRVYDFPVYPGMDTCLALRLMSGEADLSMALFRADSFPYYASRYDALKIADNHIGGRSEYLAIPAPETDATYGLVVWANNAEAGRFELVTACAQRGQPAADGRPESFALAAEGGGTFSGRVTVRFDLPETDEVTVRIYDTQGRLVRTIAQTEHPAGRYRATWDGRDSRGREVAAGSYIVRFISRNHDGEEKLVKVE